MPELSVVATAQSTSPVHAAVGGLIALAVAIGKMKRIAILP